MIATALPPRRSTKEDKHVRAGLESLRNCHASGTNPKDTTASKLIDQVRSSKCGVSGRIRLMEGLMESSARLVTWLSCSLAYCLLVPPPLTTLVSYPVYTYQPRLVQWHVEDAESL